MLKVGPFHTLVAYLEQTRDYAKGAAGPTLTLMGVVGGVHDALEAAMVCKLGQKSLRKPGDPEGKTKIFSDLLNLCRSSKFVRLDQSEANDILRMHDDFRGNFTHTKPRFVHISYREAPRLVTLYLKAIEQIMSEELWLSAPDGDQKQRFEDALETIRANLHRLPQ